MPKSLKTSPYLWRSWASKLDSRTKQWVKLLEQDLAVIDTTAMPHEEAEYIAKQIQAAQVALRNMVTGIEMAHIGETEEGY